MEKKTIEKLDGFQVLEESDLEKVNAGGPAGQYTNDDGGSGGEKDPPPPPIPYPGPPVITH